MNRLNVKGDEAYTINAIMNEILKLQITNIRTVLLK